MPESGVYQIDDNFSGLLAPFTVEEVNDFLRNNDIDNVDVLDDLLDDFINRRIGRMGVSEIVNSLDAHMVGNNQTSVVYQSLRQLFTIQDDEIVAVRTPITSELLKELLTKVAVSAIKAALNIS